MRRFIALLLVLSIALLVLPVSVYADNTEFGGLSDPKLLQYIEDAVYSELEEDFQSDDYRVEDISSVYLSAEYLEDLAYNSQENIYFGYELSELEEQFQGTKYIFTLGDDGRTTVKAFESYDDTFEKVVQNVAIGTGVILVCVTVSAVSGGLGVSTISAVFAASAKTGTAFALSSGVISGTFSGIVKGVQTGNFDDAMKAAALSGSEGFKWGAISGAVTGGITKAVALNKPVPSPRDAELAALKKYGGSDQVSFLGGKEVAYGTPGATRPDIVVEHNGVLEAIEVKRYDLANEVCRERLKDELLRQVKDRVINLPEGSTQRIVLNVEGRNFASILVEEVKEELTKALFGVYPNIPIDVMGAVI